MYRQSTSLALTIALLCLNSAHSDDTLSADTAQPELKQAVVDGTGEGWRDLGEKDFVNVNCRPDTWSWKDGVAYCTGQPVGVIRSKEPIKNFEMVCEWKHKQKGGNSGVFIWASQKSIDNLLAGNGRLPHGIEVQVLDLGYAELYEQGGKRKARLVHVTRRCVSHGPSQDDTVPPGRTEWQAQLSERESDKGNQSMESLLHSRHQW